MRLTPSDIKLILRNKESLSDKMDFLTDVQLETEDDYIFRLCEAFRWVLSKKN
jgi:hypothetical protein